MESNKRIINKGIRIIIEDYGFSVPDTVFQEQFFVTPEQLTYNKFQKNEILEFCFKQMLQRLQDNIKDYEQNL